MLDPKPVITALALSSTMPAWGTVLHASAVLTGRPPFSYFWTLDDNSLGASGTLDWLVSGSPGPHALTLRATNASGTASLSRTITVEPPQVLLFQTICLNPLCLWRVGAFVNFNLVLSPSAHPSRYEYDWLGTGVFTESSATPVPFHVYTMPGSYWPRVRVTSAAGTEPSLRERLAQGALRLVDEVALALSGFDRLEQLEGADAELRALRAHLHLAFELEILDEEVFLTLAEQANTVGRQVGGWLKKLRRQRGEVR